jgi:signal peptidase I
MVNGRPLNEQSYVYPGNTPCSDDPDGGQFKVTVPKGYIWVMGDHRQNSRDSRYNQNDKHHGMVPVKQVVGRAIVRAWPINRWGTLPVPDTFDQQGIDQQSPEAAGALPVAPSGVALSVVVPLVVWRRRRAKVETGTGTTTTATGTR